MSFNSLNEQVGTGRTPWRGQKGEMRRVFREPLRGSNCAGYQGCIPRSAFCTRTLCKWLYKLPKLLVLKRLAGGDGTNGTRGTI